MKAIKQIPALFTLVLVSLTFMDVSAQQDTTLYKIETRDGNEFIGRIVTQDQTTIVFQTEKFGEITINKSDVKSIIAILKGRSQDGSYWFENPQATRYFWQPNGYGLRKGESYYQNIWIFFNQVSVGVTDNFSIGLGIVPLFLFAGAPTPVWITPKFSIPIAADKFNLGAGALMGTVLGEEESGFGIAYGVSTFGSRDKNVSVGLGYGYAGGDWATSPTISLSAMIRTGERGYFITENYYIGSGGDNLVLLSLGGRRIVKRVGIDFALVMPVDAGDFFAFPILGLTVPFGNVPNNVLNNASK
jgi:hypothetical protein